MISVSRRIIDVPCRDGELRYFLKALQNDDRAISDNARVNLEIRGKQGDAETISGLIYLLNAQELLARNDAASVLGVIGRNATSATPALINSLCLQIRFNGTPQTDALEQIAKEEPSTVIPQLISAMKNSIHPLVRAGCAQVFDGLRECSSDVQIALRNALYDSDPNVRLFAASGLRGVVKAANEKKQPINNTILPSLINSLNDKVSFVQLGAMSTLAYFKGQAFSATSQIALSLNAREKYIPPTASFSLRSIAKDEPLQVVKVIRNLAVFFNSKGQEWANNTIRAVSERLFN